MLFVGLTLSIEYCFIFLTDATRSLSLVFAHVLTQVLAKMERVVKLQSLASVRSFSFLVVCL
jgi:hypothetical protein